MDPSRSDEGSGRPTRPWANDRWKAGWSDRVACGILAAVALHAAVFGLWPEWDATRRSTVPTPLGAPASWIVLYELPSGGGEALPVVGAPIGDVADSAVAEAALRDRAGAPDGDASALVEALRERLLGGGAMRPTVAASGAEPPPVDEVPVAGAGRDDPASIAAAPSSAEVPEVPGADELMLDRLSGIHPGLALSSSSAWVLLRNPLEVERFMEANPGHRWLRGDAAASVSVTLWIDESGSVEWAEVHESSGREQLDEIAMSLFTDVVAFRPALDRGVPVPKSVTFTLNFPW